MSIPQKSLFSLLSLCQNFYNPSKFGKVMTKNKFAQFFETRCRVKSWLSLSVSVTEKRFACFLLSPLQ